MDKIDSIYLPPLKDGYTIYTKNGCPFCVKAKDLLDVYQPYIVDCDVYLSENKEGFLEYVQRMTNIRYRTFPMIFFNGYFVGGYTEIKTHLDKENAFAEF
jgi:glutaredoxin 1/glutaredoxin 3